MKVTDDRIQRVEQIQMEIVNDNRSDRIKYYNIQNIEKGTVSSTKNQSDDGIDKFVRKNAIDNERYELAEARNAVKYVKHFVEGMKPVIDQNSAKPKDYDKWTNKQKCEHIIDNIKTYMPSIPDSLLFFIPATLHRADCGRNSTDKPIWLDMEKFQRGQKFARDHIFSIIFANMLSLYEIFTFTDGFKPIIFSQQSHTPHLAFKRYLSTFHRIRNWMTEDPWTVGTRAYNDVQTVRRMHRAIRLELCERDNEEIEKATKIQKPWLGPDRKTILEDLSSCPYPTVENGCIHLLVTPKGLNQADMGATQFAFLGMILLYPHELGIYASDEDMAAFCHTWRCIGYLLGMEDQYNFCRGSVKEIKQRSHDFIKIWVKPYLRVVGPEWEHMLRCFTEGSSYLGPTYLGYTFKMLLMFVTDLLNIDMPRTRHTLTYFERFYLMFHRFVFRYVIKLPFVRKYVNKLINETIDKAAKYGPEKHKLLKKRSQLALNKGQ